MQDLLVANINVSPKPENNFCNHLHKFSKFLKIVLLWYVLPLLTDIIQNRFS